MDSLPRKLVEYGERLLGQTGWVENWGHLAKGDLGITVNLLTYVTWSELNRGIPSTAQEFREHLASYKRSSVVYICGAVNSLLRVWDIGSFDPESQRLVIDAAFPATVAAALTEMVLHRTNPRAVFLRTQLLFVAKQAILHCTEDARDPLAQMFWGGLGRVFLMANDHLHFGLTTKGATGDPLKVLTELAPVSEYTGVHGFEHKFARSFQMLNVVSPGMADDPQFVDIGHAFRQSAGLEFATFQALTFGVLTKYMLLNTKSYLEDPTTFYLVEDYLKTTAIPQDEIGAYFRITASSLDDLRARFAERDFGPADFTWFRDKPLIQAGQAYFPLDTAFLAEKGDAGVFCTVHNAYTSSKQRQSLHIFWGLVFERYVAHLLQVTASPGKNVVVPSPHYNSCDDQICDAIVLCGSALVLIECKGTTFTAEAKYSGVPEKLASEIKDKLGNGQQLATAVIRLFARGASESCREIDLSGVKTIYPVLVTRDELGGYLIVNRYLEDQFRSLLNPRTIRPRTVTPLFCMSIDALEKVAAYLSDACLTDILHARYQGEKGLNSTFIAVPNSLIEALGERKNTFVNDSLAQFEKQVEGLLFPSGESAPMENDANTLNT